MNEGQGLGEQGGEGGMEKEEEQGEEREIARENQLCHGICSSELWELRGFPAGRAGAEDAGCWGKQSPGTLDAHLPAMPSARLSPDCGFQPLLSWLLRVELRLQSTSRSTCCLCVPSLDTAWLEFCIPLGLLQGSQAG